MYLGMVLIVLGLSVLLGSATAFGVVPVFALLLDHRFIAEEERALHEVFGDEFRRFRSRTRRWV